MSFQGIFNLVLAILTAFRGVGVIILSIASWAGNVWAGQIIQNDIAEHSRKPEKLRNSLLLEAESYKVKPKKPEVFFAKELKATSGFIKVNRSILPRQ